MLCHDMPRQGFCLAGSTAGVSADCRKKYRVITEWVPRRGRCLRGCRCRRIAAAGLWRLLACLLAVRQPGSLLCWLPVGATWPRSGTGLAAQALRVWCISSLIALCRAALSSFDGVCSLLTCRDPSVPCHAPDQWVLLLHRPLLLCSGPLRHACMATHTHALCTKSKAGSGSAALPATQDFSVIRRSSAGRGAHYSAKACRRGAQQALGAPRIHIHKTLCVTSLLQPNREHLTFQDTSIAGCSAGIKCYCLSVQYEHFMTSRDEVSDLHVCLILCSIQCRPIGQSDRN